MDVTESPIAAPEPSPRIRRAQEGDRDAIYRLRHQAFADELGQYAATADGRLSDALDLVNEYVLAEVNGALAGFVSITLGYAGALSLDKYLDRAELPFAVTDSVYEVRTLTVDRRFRGAGLGTVLMYAALRLLEEHGASRVLAMGRTELVPMYERFGLVRSGIDVQAGRVSYAVLSATVPDLVARAATLPWLRDGLDRAGWQHPEPACFHGGASVERAGRRLETPDPADVVNADVLDAWFPPAPAVTRAVADHAEWALRTSPPTYGTGLLDALAEACRVPRPSLLLGAGSSALIYLAFTRLLNPQSTVLLLDPTYGEYDHVLSNVVGCRVRRLPLRREEGYDLDPRRLLGAASDADMVVLVNPNSPTGRHVDREELLPVLQAIPPETLVWIDETYVNYVVPAQSLAPEAATSPNLLVCTSMSKAYALSGARVARLCGAPPLIRELARLTPPWAVGTVGQLAALRALECEEYYREHWKQTRSLRDSLRCGLVSLGLDVVPGSANFLLAHLPADGPDADTVRRRCTERAGVFLRDASAMGTTLGDRALRIAVKDEDGIGRITASLAGARAR